MIPEVPLNQQRALANLVWNASQELAKTPAQSLVRWIEQWSDVTTRSTVAAELLRCVAGAVELKSDWLASRLSDCSPYWDTPEQRREAVQGIYTDRIENKRVTTWFQFSGLGDSPDTLKLRYEHDPVYLGQFLEGRYRCVARIGNGGFGVVFRGEDDHDRVTALKLPYGPSELLPKCAALLREEASILENLSGTGIPAFYELLELPNECPVLVMQYISGGSLFSLAQRQRLDVLRAAQIVEQLAMTLDQVHARGFVHGDVKPENILIDETGTPYITDFGLALDEAARFSDRRSLGMTPAYAAPEVIAGLKQQLDARSDVYALGAILAELLTGRRLIRGNTREDALVEGIVAGSRVLELPAEVPTALREVCQQALSLDPNERHNTAAEFAAAVCRAVGDAVIFGKEQFNGTFNKADKISATEDFPRLCQLRAWRMGMKLGGAVERHAHYRRMMQSVPLEIDADNLAEARRSFNAALGHELGASILCDELRTVAEEAGFTVTAVPHKDAVWQAFYTARNLPSEQITLLRAVVEDVSCYLDNTYETILAALHREPIHARSFAFAVRVNLVGISSEARQTLESEARNSGLPPQLWESFVSLVNRGELGADLQRVVGQLDKRMETFLLRGDKAC